MQGLMAFQKLSECKSIQRIPLKHSIYSDWSIRLRFYFEQHLMEEYKTSLSDIHNSSEEAALMFGNFLETHSLEK